MPSDIQLLTQADSILNACGRPRPPREGVSVLPLRKGFLVQVTFAANTTSPTQTITKEITGDVDWWLDELQVTSTTATAIAVQFLLPNGKFLISQLQDVLQIAGYGSYSYAFRPALRCPIGTKIQVAFEVTNVSSQQSIAVFCDGAYRFGLKSQGTRICPTDEAVENLPRYFDDPNQNIMAPGWQHGVVDPPPPGWYDEEFTYSALQPPTATFPAGAPGSSILVTGANLTATQQIGMDASEFYCQRIMVQVTADNTVTAGSILARLRLGSGQAIFDDYLDVARYLGSSRMPLDIVIAPNDIVYADLQAVDTTGTGNIYWTMFLEGFKRRRRL